MAVQFPSPSLENRLFKSTERRVPGLLEVRHPEHIGQIVEEHTQPRG